MKSQFPKDVFVIIGKATTDPDGRDIIQWEGFGATEPDAWEAFQKAQPAATQCTVTEWMRRGYYCKKLYLSEMPAYQGEVPR